MQLKLWIYIFLSLFLYKSECAELNAMHATSSATATEEEQPTCPICFNDIKATSMIIVYPCNGKDNHYMCKSCYDNSPKKTECCQCMQQVAPNLKAQPFSKHKDFFKSHCKQCFEFYPHNQAQDALCTNCRPAARAIPTAKQSIQNLNTNTNTPNSNEEEEETWQSKLTTLVGEGSVAFVGALTARTLYDKGLLQHERASERNSAWSTVAGAFIASNRLLEYVQPNRKTNAATLSSSWLIGGVIGLVLPTLIKNTKTQTTPRK